MKMSDGEVGIEPRLPALEETDHILKGLGDFEWPKSPFDWVSIVITSPA